MKGYDTLNETAPTAPPPYSPYQQQPYNQATIPVYQMQPSRPPPPIHTTVQVNSPMRFPVAPSVVVRPNSKECCCCCCSCPFWVCCLVIGLILLVSILSSLSFVKS